MNCSLGSRLLGTVAVAAAMVAGPAWAQPVQEPVTGLIVKLKPQSGAKAGVRESAASARDRVMSVARAAGFNPQSDRAVGSQGHYLLRLPAAESGRQLDATIERLRQQPDVLAVEPDVRIKRLNVPNDPGYTSQWYLQSPTVVPPGLNMPLAWDTTTGSSAITVALVDTGVRFSHPDLAGRLLPGYDFVSDTVYANDGDGRDADASDPGDWVSLTDRTGRPAYFGSCNVESSSWHGTFIAGQMAAIANNSQGIAGLNWSSQVLPVRVAGKCGAMLSDLLDGLRWAAGLPVEGVPVNSRPARVINLSFAGDRACTTAYQDVVNEITNAGALLVVAAGNESTTPKRPGDCRGVLTVAAVQEDGRKADYSNLGSTVALSAPGGSSAKPLYSTLNNGTMGPGQDTYGQYIGSSFAAPLATGVASLMLSVNPSLTPAQLMQRMQQSTRPHLVVPGALTCSSVNSEICNCTTTTCGAGLLDAAAAVAHATSGQTTDAVIAPVASVAAGTTVQLDGSLSTAATGRTLSAYQWTQVSGVMVGVQNATAAIATVTLPSEGRFTFQLMVTDSAGRTAQSTVTVVSTSGANGEVPDAARWTGGGGGGAMAVGWGVALWMWVGAVWLSRRRAAKLERKAV